MAGLALIVVPLLTLLLLLFGVYGVVKGGPNLFREGELALLIWAGVAYRRPAM